MYLLATGGACLFLERPLPAMWTLRAMPLLMLVNTLPGHLFFAVRASSSGLESRLRRSMTTTPTLARVAMTVVWHMTAEFHF